MTETTEKTVEQELRTITKISRRVHESEQAYLNRLCDASRELPDDEWESLSTPAQVWVNVATTSQNDKTPLESLKGSEPGESVSDEGTEAIVEDTEDEDVDETSEEDSEDTAESDTEESDTKESDTKQDEKVARKSENGKREVPRKQAASASRYVKLLVARNPKITLDEVRVKLDEMDLPLSDLSLATLMSDMRTTLKVLRDAGLINIPE